MVASTGAPSAARALLGVGPGRRPALAAVALLAAVAVGALACARVPEHWAATVRYGVPGLLGLLASAGLLTRHLRMADAVRLEPWRAAFVVSVVCSSLGWVTLAVGAAYGPLAPATIGDACLGLGLVVALWGLTRMPQQREIRIDGLRLVLDALLQGSAAVYLAWPLAIGPRTGFVVTPDAARDLIVVLLVGVAFVACVLIAVRQGSRASLLSSLVTAGSAVVVTITTLYARNGDRVPDGIWSAASCIAWPALVIGLAFVTPPQFQAAESSSLEDTRHTRVAAVSSCVALVQIVVAVALAAISHRGMHPVDLALLVGLLTVAGLRELVGAVARAGMVRRLGELAYEDPLTRLANRRALADRIRTADPDAAWTVLDLDLDGFGKVNDVLGAEAGDEVLLAVARELARACPNDGVAARIGPDEFVLLLRADLAGAKAVAERLVDALRPVLTGLGGGLVLTASVGVGRLALTQDADTDGARLTALAEASAALRTARLDGRDRVCVHDGDVARRIRRSREVERRLPGAVAADRFTVAVQPLVDLRTGAAVGVEALARWTDDELGAIGPDEFIPLAERSSELIGGLGRHVLQLAARNATDLGLAAAGLEVGVNVSPVQLLDRQFLPLVRAVLDESGLPAHRLVLEVTEAVLLDEDASAPVLSGLKDLGVRLAIDDFGAGYSALGYLRRIPFDVLKIDRSWTVAAAVDPRTRDVVATVNDLAHRFGAVVVMEGIEDASVAQVCTDLGADLGQGWHFGRPAPFVELAPSLLSRARSAGQVAAAQGSP